MRVVKRNGQCENLSFDKISRRLQYLCDKFHLNNIDVHKITQKVVSSLKDGITTTEIDEETAKVCSDLYEEPQLLELAGIVSVSNHHKNTPSTFWECTQILYDAGKVNESYYHSVQKNKHELEQMIRADRDYAFDYFAFKTLTHAYLLKVEGHGVVEKISYLWMRVAVGIHGDNLERIKETYDLLSQRYFTHASPTLFNIGTNRQQCSSCFLLGCEDDLESMYKMVKDCAQISKHAGGIGVHLHNIRSNGSLIRSTGGVSNGVVKYIKVLNETARHINQGGKRKGSIAIYLEPHHADILQFLDLRKNTGKEELRARDIFTALWISDEFMIRLEQALNGNKDVEWFLFNPDDSKCLNDTYGDEFTSLYNQLVADQKYVSKINILELWYKVLDSQIETGTPYICYKDHVNRKSNQINHGIIRSSNLCSEIVQYSDSKETAVCNLASICLPQFVVDELNFDFAKLHEVAKIITRNMNIIIDINYYPTPETRASNMFHRPIGVGVQGLADVYIKMRIPFESDEAQDLNRKIFETIYHGCIESSLELAKEHGAYTTFNGSPISFGKFQFNLWGKESTSPDLMFQDWSDLQTAIMKYGLRNSLLTTCMPTASTAQIMGNNESIEPYTSNIYKRRTLAGEFTIFNKHLIKDLQKYNLWSTKTIESIIANNGSVQHISGLPDGVKKLYKTVWEISQKVLIDQAASRGLFIDQSQSLNLWLKNPTYGKLSAMHTYSWKQGLKTGIYYLRTMAAIEAQNVLMCTSKEECTSCSA